MELKVFVPSRLIMVVEKKTNEPIKPSSGYIVTKNIQSLGQAKERARNF